MKNKINTTLRAESKPAHFTKTLPDTTTHLIFTMMTFSFSHITAHRPRPMTIYLPDTNYSIFTLKSKSVLSCMMYYKIITSLNYKFQQLRHILYLIEFLLTQNQISKMALCVGNRKTIFNYLSLSAVVSRNFCFCSSNIFILFIIGRLMSQAN